MLSIKLFFAYIFSKRNESLVRVLAKITLASSFLSVFSLILVISIMNGFNRNMADKLLAVEPHISILKSDITDEGKFVKAIPKGASISYFEQQDIVLRTLDGLFSGAIARGMEKSEIFAMLKRLNNTSENNVVDTSAAISANEVLIGFDLARSLNLFEGDELSLVAPESLLLPPGEIIPIEKVRVSQIVQSDVSNFDSKAMIYLSDPGLPRLRKARTKEERVEIFLQDPNDVDHVVSDLKGSALAKNAVVATWKSNNLPLFFALRMEKWAMSSLLGLSVLVTSFSLVMVILMLISDKRKDIGMMMTMGLSKHRLVRVFTFLGFLLAGLGSLMGLSLGVLAALGLEKYPINFMPDIYADTHLPAEVNWMQVITIAAFLILLALLSAWLPVKQLANATPSENLRNQFTQKH